MPSIDFVLDQFNGDLAMSVKALLETGIAPVSITADATAIYEIKTDAMKNAFYFRSDSRDMSDNPTSDIKYYVNWPSAYKLNPAHAFVDIDPVATTDADGAIPNNRMLVKHDFVRHIAKKLFNTHLGVDLFSNEAAVVEDIASKGNDAWTNNIKSAIDAVSSGGALVTNGYTTNALDTSANLCRVLFKQITAVEPARLYDLSLIEKDAVNNEFYLPFKGGDSISFKVVIKSTNDQKDIIGGSGAVDDRSYKIKIKIVDGTPSNVVVDDGAFTTSRVIVT